MNQLPDDLPQLPPGVWDNPRPEDYQQYTDFVRQWFKNDIVEAQAELTRADLITSYYADFGSGIHAYNFDFRPIIEAIELPESWPEGISKGWWTSWGKTQIEYLLEIALGLESLNVYLQSYAEIADEVTGTPFSANLGVDLGSGIGGSIWFRKNSSEDIPTVELQVISDPWQVTVALEYNWTSGIFKSSSLLFERTETTKVSFTDGSSFDYFEEDFFISPDVLGSPDYEPIPPGCECEKNPVASSATAPFTFVTVLDRVREIYTLRMKIKPGASRVATTNRIVNRVLVLNSITYLVADSTSIRLFYTGYSANDGDEVWSIEADPDEWHDFVITRDEDQIVKIYFDGVLTWTHDDNDDIAPVSWAGNLIFDISQATAQVQDNEANGVIPPATYPNEIKDISLHCNAVDAETIAEWHSTNAGIDDIIIRATPYKGNCDDYDYDYDYDGGGSGGRNLCEDWGYYEDNFAKYPYSPSMSITEWVDDESGELYPGTKWLATGDGQTDPIANNGDNSAGLQWQTLTDYTRNQLSIGYGEFTFYNGLVYNRGNFIINMGHLLSADGDSPQLVGLMLRAINPNSPFVYLCVQQLDTEPDENGRHEYHFQCREVFNNDPEDPSSTILDNTWSPATDIIFRWKEGDRCEFTIQDCRWVQQDLRPGLFFIQGWVGIGGGGSDYAYSAQFRFYTNLNQNFKRLYTGIFLSAKDRETEIDAVVNRVTLTYTECYSTTNWNCCGANLDFGLQIIPPEGGPGGMYPPWYEEMWNAIVGIYGYEHIFDCGNLEDGWLVLYEATGDYGIKVSFAIDDDGPKMRWSRRLVDPPVLPSLTDVDSIIYAEEIYELGYTYWRFELNPFMFWGTVYLPLQMDCSNVTGRGKLLIGSPGAIVTENLAGTGGLLIKGNSALKIIQRGTGGVIIGSPGAIITQFETIRGTGGVLVKGNSTGSLIVETRVLKVVTFKDRNYDTNGNCFLWFELRDLEINPDATLSASKMNGDSVPLTISVLTENYLSAYITGEMFAGQDSVYKILSEVVDE